MEVRPSPACTMRQAGKNARGECTRVSSVLAAPSQSASWRWVPAEGLEPDAALREI